MPRGSYRSKVQGFHFTDLTALIEFRQGAGYPDVDVAQGRLQADGPPGVFDEDWL